VKATNDLNDHPTRGAMGTAELISHAEDLAREHERIDRAMTAGPWSVWNSNSFRRITALDRRDGGVLSGAIQRGDRQVDLCGENLDEDLAGICDLRDAAPRVAFALRAMAEEIRRLVAAQPNWSHVQALQQRDALIQANVEAKEKIRALQGERERNRVDPVNPPIREWRGAPNAEEVQDHPWWWHRSSNGDLCVLQLDVDLGSGKIFDSGEASTGACPAPFDAANWPGEWAPCVAPGDRGRTPGKTIAGGSAMSPAERRLAAELLRVAAESFSNHGCNEFDLAAVVPDVEERRAIMRRYEERNSGGQDFDPELDYRIGHDWILMHAMANRLDP
jgi:hypothetical protein